MILTFEGRRSFYVKLGRATLDTCNAPRILGTKSTFAGTEENDENPSNCIVQNLPNARLFIASSGISKWQE